MKSMRESGAAAVEFALVLPVLLILILGMIEFGFLTFLNSSAAGAAREGAREMAIHNDQGLAQGRASSAFSNATGRVPTSVSVPPSCTAGQPVVVTVTYSYATLTSFFGATFAASGTGEMRCAG